MIWGAILVWSAERGSEGRTAGVGGEMGEGSIHNNWVKPCSLKKGDLISWGEKPHLGSRYSTEKLRMASLQQAGWEERVQSK